MQSQNKREGESENSHFLFAANVTPPACVDSVSFMVEQSCTFVQRAVRVLYTYVYNVTRLLHVALHCTEKLLLPEIDTYELRTKV